VVRFVITKYVNFSGSEWTLEALLIHVNYTL